MSYLGVCATMKFLIMDHILTFAKKAKRRFFSILLILFVSSLAFDQAGCGSLPAVKNVPPPAGPTMNFIASIDTMKVSRDTETRPLSPEEILDIVQLSASINTNYITVDTRWDYPAYLQEWVDAV